MKRSWSAEQIEKRLLKAGYKKTEAIKKKPMFSEEDDEE